MRTLVDYRPALRSRTGVGEYVHELARALVRTSAGAGSLPEAPLFLFSSSWADRLAPNAVPGAQTIDRRWPVRLLNHAWHDWQWPPVEWVIGRQIDVVQSMHPLVIPARHAARLVTIHDLDFLDHPERTSGEIRRDYPRLSRAHAQLADHIVTVSHFSAGEIVRRLGVPRSKVSVCSAGAPDWAPRHEEPPTGYILFLGAIETRKNLGVLLDAYEKLVLQQPSAPRLVLAGKPGEGAAPWLERIARSPLAGHVDLPGYVPAEARRELMIGAHVLVMPSLMEGFGIPALEAMSLGVPVIVSNRGSLPEVVGDAGVIFDLEQPNDLCESLERVLGSATERRQMAARGIARSKNYSWDQTAQKTRDAWQLAVDERDRRRRG